MQGWGIHFFQFKWLLEEVLIFPGIFKGAYICLIHIYCVYRVYVLYHGVWSIGRGGVGGKYPATTLLYIHVWDTIIHNHSIGSYMNL